MKKWSEIFWIHALRITNNRDKWIQRKKLIQGFNEKLCSSNIQRPKSDVINSFSNKLTATVSKIDHIVSYSEDKFVKRIGGILYDKRQLNEKIAKQLYGMISKDDLQKQELEEWQQTSVKESDITKMLKRQIELFTSVEANDDYRKILDSQNEDDAHMNAKYLFEKYLHQPLVDFMERITKCGKYKEKDSEKSKWEACKDTLKV